MTGREFQKLARKYLIPELPGFEAKGRLLFAAPIDHILRGYSCEPSAFDRSEFCVEVFVQPLFVPDDCIVLTIGDRLGAIRGRQDMWWTYTEQNEAEVMNEVLSHMFHEGPVILDKFKTLEEFVRNAINRQTNPYSPYPPEMVAYGAVLLGNARLARKMFDRLEWTLRDESDREPYEEEILKRARLVRETFARNSDEAVAILNKWRDETAAALKLTKFIEADPL